MFNNFVDQESTYQCCSVVQPPSNGNGALLIGDFNSATDEQKIKQHNIKTIITAASGMEHLSIPKYVEHIIYPLLDASSENISRFFNESTLKIKNSLRNGGVLVHCAAGISRSATLVIAYIMKTKKITFKEAIALIRIARNVRPNLGFQRQLKQYQKEIINQSENRMVLKKTITQKMPEERRTSYNRSSHMGRMFNDYLKFNPQPRTAQQGARRKIQGSRRFPFPHSQSRPRDKKNFKVRQVCKQSFFVFGQAHGIKQIKIYKIILVILNKQNLPLYLIIIRMRLIQIGLNFPQKGITDFLQYIIFSLERYITQQYYEIQVSLYIYKIQEMRQQNVKRALPKQGYAPDLNKYLARKLRLKLNGGRQVEGIVIGVDVFMNVALEKAYQIVGNQLVRGNSILMWELLEKVTE